MLLLFNFKAIQDKHFTFGNLMEISENCTEKKLSQNIFSLKSEFFAEINSYFQDSTNQQTQAKKFPKHFLEFKLEFYIALVNHLLHKL